MATEKETAASKGYAIKLVISGASTNATLVHGFPGYVYGWVCSNVNAAARYLKLYDLAAAPTVGTDTAVLITPIPGATTGGLNGQQIPGGLWFKNGIALALTTGVAQSDTGAVAANDIVVNLFYSSRPPLQ